MTPQHIILSITISFIWGLNFVAAKDAVSHFPSLFLLALRLSIVALILLPFLKGRTLSLFKLFKISFVLTVLHFGMMFTALEKGLDASVAVVIDQLRVPMAAMLGYFIFGETLDKRGLAGIAIAILGTFVIVGAPNVINNYDAFWMLIGCSAAWSVYNIMVKNIDDIKVLPFIGWVSILGAPQLFLLSFIIEGNNFHLIKTAPLSAIISLFYVAIAATIVAHGCWYYLLKKHTVNQVVPYSLLVPVFGVLSGVLLLSEKLTWETVIGGLLTVAGVAIVVVRKPKMAKGGDNI